MSTTIATQSIAATPGSLAGGADTKQPYAPPEIVYEAPLEVRAGTPLRLPDPLNLGLDKMPE